MATVYRKTFTKPLPEGAELFEQKGVPHARWLDSRGKVRVAQVTTGRDGAARVSVTASTFTAKYRDGQGVLREVATGCRTKSGAMSKLKDLLERAERVRSGIMTPDEDRVADHQDAPLEDHIAAFLAHQSSRDLHEARVKNTTARLKRVREECGFKRLADVTAVAFENWLLEQKRQKMSAGTRNAYREAWVGFCNWCVRTHRLLNNPLVAVPKADAAADCRRKRRALTEEELKRLLAAARERPLLDAQMIRRGKNKGQPLAQVSEQRRAELERIGWERSLVYKAYLLTGLRKSELASLTVAQLDLEAEVPYATLKAADEKNRQGSDIPIRADLAEDLRQWLSEKLRLMRAEALRRGQSVPERLPPETPLFYVPDGLLRILDRDLQLAGIAKVDERGRTVDIHALRYTFGTHLSKGGVAPRTAQAAMRHSSIDLTMNVYTDPKLLDVHGALNALPELPLDGRDSGSDREESTLSATGTGGSADRALAPLLAPTSCKRVHLESIADQITTAEGCDSRAEEIVVSLSPVRRKQPQSGTDNGCQKSGRPAMHVS